MAASDEQVNDFFNASQCPLDSVPDLASQAYPLEPVFPSLSQEPAFALVELSQHQPEGPVVRLGSLLKLPRHRVGKHYVEIDRGLLLAYYANPYCNLKKDSTHTEIDFLMGFRDLIQCVFGGDVYEPCSVSSMELYYHYLGWRSGHDVSSGFWELVLRFSGIKESHFPEGTHKTVSKVFFNLVANVLGVEFKRGWDAHKKKNVYSNKKCLIAKKKAFEA